MKESSPQSRGDSAETSRGPAAAATWRFRGDESRQQRGCHVDIPRKRAHAAKESAETDFAERNSTPAVYRGVHRRHRGGHDLSGNTTRQSGLLDIRQNFAEMFRSTLASRCAQKTLHLEGTVHFGYCPGHATVGSGVGVDDDGAFVGAGDAVGAADGCRTNVPFSTQK